MKTDCRSDPDYSLRELAVFSLESWDAVWRRNQFFVDALLRRNRTLRVLFVEPPSDPLDLLQGGIMPRRPRFRRLRGGRMWLARPVKPGPRRLGSWVDQSLFLQVRGALRILAFSQPLFWVNDPSYAPLVNAAKRPSVYDITDDWIAGASSFRESERLLQLEDLLFSTVDEVVVCSDDLMRSRGHRRRLTLVRNGVDSDHFRAPHPRPVDLAPNPVAVYAGTLHESRLDIDLVVQLSESIPQLSIVLIGPNSLSRKSSSRLRRTPGVTLLGPRPYSAIPAYLQHANVIIVPHLVNAFTESLDPIKAYECLVAETPTVATPVAGFRELADSLMISKPEKFAASVREVLDDPQRASRIDGIPSWEQRVCEFERVLLRAQARHDD